MTLQEFRAATANLNGNTLIGYLAPWGELTPAIIADKDELTDDDPVRDLLTSGILVITTAEPEPAYAY